MSKTFTYELTILEHHLDTYGHVNNAVYLTILEEARWDMVTEQGWGLKRVLEEKKGPIVLEIHIRFKKELSLRDRVKIVTRCVEYDRTVGTMRQEIQSLTGEVHAVAEMKFALFDLANRKLLRATEEWRRVIGAD